MDIERLNELKEEIQTAKTERDKAQGAIEQIEADWKENHDCENAEEVQNLIDSYKKQVEKLSKKYDILISTIEEKIEAFQTNETD